MGGNESIGLGVSDSSFTAPNTGACWYHLRQHCRHRLLCSVAIKTLHVIKLFHVVNLVDLWCLVVLGSTLAKSRAAQTTWIGIVRFPHQGGCGVGTIGIVRFPEHHLVCSSGPTLLLKPALTD